MDVSNLEGLAQANLQSAVSVKVAKKAMDAAKAEGEAIVKLIEAAGEISPDGHVDIEA